jgi:hypothetical protein
MRMMSFALTERQLMDGTKTVTRRTGWQNLRPGEKLLAVRKAMGLKAGEKVQPLCEIEVVSVRRIPLADIDKADCAAEGFPHLSPDEFTMMFIKHMGIRVAPDECQITRIEFRKVPSSERVPVQSTLPMLVA